MSADALDALLDERPGRGWRRLAFILIALVAGGVVWAWQAQLDEVAVAEGEVVPQGQVKLIQHLEGGIVERTDVREGATVSAGDPLLQLDLGSSGLDQDELQIRLDGLLLTQARLKAEAEGVELTLPPEPAGRQPQLAGAELAAFTGRRRQMVSALEVLAEQVSQRRLEIAEIEARLRATRADLKLAREFFEQQRPLMEDGLIPRFEVLQLEREVQALIGELESLETELPRAEAAQEEARSRERDTVLRFRREAAEAMGDVEREMARLRQIPSRATDQQFRTEILSPIDGVVKNLSATTIGGVVRPGEPIMEIVPTRDKLVVEVHLNPVDVGYVRVGQAAVVKVTTYDFIRYGGLDGTVVNVAADADTDPMGQPYFRVVVETESAYLDDNEALAIAPGMQATVDIHTGTRSVLDYLIMPVLKLQSEAFRER